jgi:hypothetical protein
MKTDTCFKSALENATHPRRLKLGVNPVIELFSPSIKSPSTTRPTKPVSFPLVSKKPR